MARIFSTAPAWTGTIGSGGVPDASTTTIPLSSATGLTDGAYYVLSIDRVDASGNRTPAKWEVVAGQLSGTNLINCTRGVEGTAQAHSAGATVEVLFTSYHWEQLKEYLENDYILEKKASGSDINTGTEDAKIVTPKAIADSYLYTEGGWIPARETWTYASSNSFTISGDQTGKYQKGDKIRLKQGGNYKYFYIINVSYSSPNTTITITGGSDYSLANSTITDNYFSKAENPQGFPDVFNFSSVLTGSGGSAGSYAETNFISVFNIQGRRCWIQVGKNVTNKGSWSGTIRVTLPVATASSFNYPHLFGLIANIGDTWNAATCFGICWTNPSTNYLMFNKTFGTADVQWSDMTAPFRVYIEGSYFF